MRTEYRNLQIG